MKRTHARIIGASSVYDLRDSPESIPACPVGVTKGDFPEIGGTGSFYLRVSPGIAIAGFAPSVSWWKDLFPVAVRFLQSWVPYPTMTILRRRPLKVKG